MKPAAPRTEVLVVGAGPTGLALALQLQRLGIHFRIVDREPAPVMTSRAIGLQARVSELLDWMGLSDQFAARGIALDGEIEFCAGGRTLLALRMGPFLRSLERESGKGAFVPRGIFIAQSETERILGEALLTRGTRVERPVTFVTFEEGGDRVISRLAHPGGADELVASRYLVSCEGAHSVIRKQAGFSFAGKTYPMRLLMADVELDWARDHRSVHVFFHRDGPCGALPLPGTRTWRILVDVGVEEGGEEPEVTLALMQRLFAERTGDAATRLSRPTWLTQFKINCRMVDRFRAGEVFLAGDAAHIHSPTGGQGIATGMQDAWNLGWKVAQVLRHGAPEGLLDTYEAERLPIARKVLAATDANTRIFLGVNAWMRLLRDALVLPLLRLERAQERLFAQVSQLGFHYRGSPLSRHQDAALVSRFSVRAGDRTPDVVFRETGGRDVSLFALLAACRPVACLAANERAARLIPRLVGLGIEAFAILPKAGAPDGAPQRHLVDANGDFERLYGARGDFLYLIRPDGHAGLVQRPIREDRLREYLAALYSDEEIARAFEGGP